MTQIARVGPPTESEYDPYYRPYIQLVTESDVLVALYDQMSEFRKLLSIVSKSQSEQLHPPYTWTIKQVVGHLIDNERVFGYRALRFATGDDVPLPGYDQNAYVDNMDYRRARLPDLVDELEYCRRANSSLLKRIPAHSWGHVGVADGNDISVRAIAYLLVGHIRHHLNIVERRLAV